MPKVLSKLLGLGQVKEESRRGNGTVTLGWAPPPMNELNKNFSMLLTALGERTRYQHGYMAWPPICLDVIVVFFGCVFS